MDGGVRRKRYAAERAFLQKLKPASQPISSLRPAPLTPLLCRAFRPPGLQGQKSSSCADPQSGRSCAPHTPSKAHPVLRGRSPPGEPPRHQQGLLWEADSTPFPIGQLKGTGFGKKLESRMQQRESLDHNTYETENARRDNAYPGDHVCREPTWPPRGGGTRELLLSPLGGSPPPRPNHLLCKPVFSSEFAQ